MTRSISQSIAILCFLILLPANSARALTQDFSQYDLSTKEGVNAAREAMAGKKLDDRSRNCVHMNSELPGIAAVGSFAYDYGCRFQGVFVKSRYFGKDDPALSKSALALLGWKTANREQREKLAQLWVKNGLLPFLTALTSKNVDFQDRSFHPPQAISSERGETVVTLWIRLPSGRSRGRAYQLREYRFSADGDFTGSKTLEDFSALEDRDG